jgi:hypothetical protein
VERIDAKTQSNSPATLNQHDAATLLAHQERCASRRIARRARTFEYHFVAIRLKMRGSSGGSALRKLRGRMPRNVQAWIDPAKNREPQRDFRQAGNLRTRQQRRAILQRRTAGIATDASVEFASIRRSPQPTDSANKSSNLSPNTVKVVSINDKNHDDRRAMVVNNPIVCQV